MSVLNRTARPGSRDRLVARAAACALLAGLLVWLVPAPHAQADEVYPVPADGTFTIDGHGYGHGHGLSQYGAEGAALDGVDYRNILAFYYPGTAPDLVADDPISVALTATGDEGYTPSESSAYRYQCDDASSSTRIHCTLTVLARAGLVVTDEKTGKTFPTTGIARFGVKSASGTLTLTKLVGSTWSTVATGLAGPISFTGPASIPVMYRDGTERDYAGAVRAVQTGGSRLIRLNSLSLDDYVRGVVPRESPASWQAAALRAQAVAARSYAWNVRAEARAASRVYDICDSTWCQVYGGVSVTPAGGSTVDLEPASTDAAVSDTARQVRTYSGTPIFAQFSSSSGGWTAAGGEPYLDAHQDGYDGWSGNPVHTWDTSLSAASLEATYPAVGTLQRIRVTARDGNGDWGGRVETVVLEGVNSSGQTTSVTVNSPRFGMRSTWWHVRSSSPTVSGPATVARGSRVQLTGSAAPNASVTVYFKTQNIDGYVARRWLTADANGAWSTSYLADVDYRYYAVSAGQQSPAGLTQAQGTTIAAPPHAAAGSAVTLSGLAAPVAPVTVRLQQADGSYADGPATTSDEHGRWSTEVTMGDADLVSQAVASGYTSPSVTTQLTATPTLSGPALVARGSVVTLTGTAQPGAAVDVWFHMQGEPGYVDRRHLTADADGAFSTTYLADVDYRYYAAYADGSMASDAGLTQAQGTTISGPALVAKGSTVTLSGLAAPGRQVRVWFHRAFQDGYTLRRWLAPDAHGRWSTTYVADADYRYYAETAEATSPTGLTQAR